MSNDGSDSERTLSDDDDDTYVKNSVIASLPTKKLVTIVFKGGVMLGSDIQSKGGIYRTYKKVGHCNRAMEHLVPKSIM